MRFSANIAVEQGVIMAVIVMALFILTRFWCTPTHIGGSRIFLRGAQGRVHPVCTVCISVKIQLLR